MWNCSKIGGGRRGMREVKNQLGDKDILHEDLPVDGSNATEIIGTCRRLRKRFNFQIAMIML